MDRLDHRGALVSAAAAVLYGSSYVATAVALRSFTPLAAASARGLLAALLLAGVMLLPAFAALRPRRTSPAGLRRLMSLGLLGGPIFIVAMNLAVALAGATITAFVAGLYAVLAAVLAVPLLGERPERTTIGSLAVALVGTALLSDLRPVPELLGGIGIGVLAAISFALFLVLSRRWGDRFELSGSAVALAAVTLTGLGVGSMLFLLADDRLVGPLRPDAAAAVLWLAVGPGALAPVLVVAAMRRLPARRASAFLLLNPPTAALGAWLLLGERMSPLQVGGAVLVLAAMAGASGAAGALRQTAAEPG